MTHPTIGFIGAGNMAASLIGGLRAKNWPADCLCAADPHIATLDALVQQHGIAACSDNLAVVSRSDIVVLAVKPQVMRSVVDALAPSVAARRPLLISIAAGIPIANLSQWLDDDTLPVVRCMPNTPALVQLGASGLFANACVSEAQRAQADSILAAVGTTAWLASEAQLDAVTALSGSGPAYFFLLMEAMAAAGQQQGLPAEVALQLTLQTALGAATMAQRSDVSPAELRRRVTSPGGTTEQAITYFQQAGFEDTVAGALAAAAHRSDELSRTVN